MPIADPPAPPVHDTSWPKAERVRRRADYVRIQGTGRKLVTRHFLAFVLPAPSTDAPTQLGITVSKRVGSAVIRNRVKRLVREAFRQHKHELPAGLLLVLVAKAEAATAGFPEVQADLRTLRVRIPKDVPKDVGNQRQPRSPIR